MFSFPVVLCFYLALAEIVQMAVLPSLRDALPGGFGALFAWQLLALAGLLAGLLRGETAGMLAGLFAALLLGFSGDPGDLGPAIVAYATLGFAAGWLARYLRLARFPSRATTLFILLVLTSLLEGIVKKIFWPAAPIQPPWLGLLTTTLLGALSYALLDSRFKRDLEID